LIAILEAVFGFIGISAASAILLLRWPALALIISAVLVADCLSIWLLVEFYGRVIKEMRKRSSR